MLSKSCNSTTGKLVKILPAGLSNSNSFNNDTLLLSRITSPRELDEYVVLESHMYKYIFDGKKISASQSRKRLSIVKISYCGKSIHRAYLSAPAEGFSKEYVALTPNSIYELSSGEKIPLLSELSLSKGCWWKYYMDHPNAAVRMSFRIGLIGILFTIILSFKEELCSLFTQLINLF
ncbi:MAG: hypothetical protein J5965_20280 [Aeriscardovia sp.]|nr:hypothetical protein [Aeriscardovia sp.]MBO6252405.1 hypothetical protein [Bacteroidaceae bacterium]